MKKNDPFDKINYWQATGLKKENVKNKHQSSW